MAEKWPKIAEKWPKIAKMAQKLPQMAQKLAPAEKNSTDISAAFCISVKSQDGVSLFFWCSCFL